MKGVHAGILPLIENSAIDDAFLRHEALSTRAKRRYHTLGRLSIVLIVATAIYTVADALIITAFSGDRLVGGIMAVLAAFGLGLQIYLLVTHQKHIWLLNRFACERLRSLKFQAFALAETVEDEAELAGAATAFGEREVARLDGELNAGISLLDQFVPREALSLPEGRKENGLTELHRAAFLGFKDLRLDYQARFAAGEVHKLQGGQRYAASLSDMLFLLGAGLVLGALFFKLAFPDAETAGAWIDFLASTTFIASIANLILDHGGILFHATSRFVKYHDDINDLPVTFEETENLTDLVGQMELLALEELHGFCQAAKTMSYRM